MLIARARTAGLTLTIDGDSLVVRGPRSASYLLPQLRESKAEVLQMLASEEAEIVWRVVAFHTALPRHGPIWPPKVLNIPETDMSGHCSLCGDALSSDSTPRFPRCQPCVRALWRVLDEREGVGVGGEVMAA